MAIIVTPKGWAIEFPTYTEEKTAIRLANDYTQTLQGLVSTIQATKLSEDATGEPNYYTLQLLSEMLPTIDDAKVMFQALLNNQNTGGM
ncbi:MAG: hypothetical protein JSS64_11600 [Bacteroidetes bacterium]|nr:hypothetical protein [Bacteroidota bacterium]